MQNQDSEILYSPLRNERRIQSSSAEKPRTPQNMSRQPGKPTQAHDTAITAPTSKKNVKVTASSHANPTLNPSHGAYNISPASISASASASAAAPPSISATFRRRSSSSLQRTSVPSSRSLSRRSSSSCNARRRPSSPLNPGRMPSLATPELVIPSRHSVSEEIAHVSGESEEDESFTSSLRANLVYDEEYMNELKRLHSGGSDRSDNDVKSSEQFTTSTLFGRNEDAKPEQLTTGKIRLDDGCDSNANLVFKQEVMKFLQSIDGRRLVKQEPSDDDLNSLLEEGDADEATLMILKKLLVSRQHTLPFGSYSLLAGAVAQLHDLYLDRNASVLEKVVDGGLLAPGATNMRGVRIDVPTTQDIVDLMSAISCKLQGSSWRLLKGAVKVSVIEPDILCGVDVVRFFPDADSGKLYKTLRELANEVSRRIQKELDNPGENRELKDTLSLSMTTDTNLWSSLMQTSLDEVFTALKKVGIPPRNVRTHLESLDSTGKQVALSA